MRRANCNNDEMAGGTEERDEADPPGALTTRRAVIVGAAAGLAGLVADSVMSARPAGAANGDAVLLGSANYASETTSVSTTLGPGLTVNTSDYAAGVLAAGKVAGVAGTGYNGVVGTGGTHGVYGTGEYGVYGISSSSGGYGVYGYSVHGTGVEGQTNAKGQSGVSGIDLSTHGGHGTYGRSTHGTGAYGHSDTGTGVYAGSTSGHALKVVGKVAFSRSGRSTVAAENTSVVVTLAGVTASSMILATLQSDAGAIAVANAVPGAGSFTINLTAAPSSAVKVAWFVIG